MFGIKFQSTRPVRGATPTSSKSSKTNSTFQSTRPVRGATVVHHALVPAVFISIHAPRAGRDSRPAWTCPASTNFNPRAPCGARPHPRKHPRLLKKFQSTRPVRGATMKGAYRWRLKHNFNPRAPCGARPASTAGTIGEVTFQSTRPVRGATKAFEGQHPTYEFQSTRPVRGATTLCSPR